MAGWAVVFFSICIIAALIWVWADLSKRYKWVAVSTRLYKEHSEHKRVTPLNIYVAFCDHFQPFWSHVYQEIAEHRVAIWCREYPKIARAHRDYLGNHPKHTFFYSEEDYNPLLLDNLYKFKKEGFGDVELLIGHHNDTVQNFKRKIEEFRDVLFFHHGLLRKSSSGLISYGFIHGYWALNNSRCDGRCCGVNNEIPVLKSTGCYADFTFPSVPGTAQPPIKNSIYFSRDTPGRARAHEHGYAAAKGLWSEDDLLLVQGPLSLSWKKRYCGILPSIETGCISDTNRYYPWRADTWMQSAVQVGGVNDHLFIKLFTHGAIDQTIHYFFGESGLHMMWQDLESRFNDGENFRLFYVSAFEMYKIIKNLCIETPVFRRDHI